MNHKRFFKLMSVLLAFVLTACQAAAGLFGEKQIGQVVATVPLEHDGVYMVAGAGGIWAMEPLKGLISRVDPQTNQVVAQFKTGEVSTDPHRPILGGIAVANERVWITLEADGELAQIDPATNKIAAHLPLGELKYPGATLPFTPVSLASDGTTLWVTDFTHNGLARFDTETGQVVSTIINVEHPEIAVDADTVWAILSNKDSVARIDPQSNTIVATIPVSLGKPGPNLITTGGGSIWVSLGSGNGVVRIDATTNKFLAKIDVEGALFMAYGHDSLWVTGGPENSCDENGKGFLARIDPETNTVVGKLELDCPGAIAIDGNFLWVDIIKYPDIVSVVKIQPNP